VDLGERVDEVHAEREARVWLLEPGGSSDVTTWPSMKRIT
jgi:hypothetical protein